MKIVLTVIIILIFTFIIEARRGCCSHHGGVCGCRCCDGTSLSAKCAPYYPDCKDKPYKPKRRSYSGSSYTVKPTISRTSVIFIQSGLKILGYYYGTIDGDMGRKTRAAIKKYQAANGLIETGEMDDNTKEIFLMDISAKSFNK